MSGAGKRIVILGAASAMAQAAARRWAVQGARLALVGRNGERLLAIAADLKARGAGEVVTYERDCASTDAAADLAAFAQAFGGLDIVLLAYGVLGDQRAMEQDAAATADLLRVDFTSAVAWCEAAANQFEKQRGGSLVVIGSVAGDRGRQSNYIYGAAKAGLGVLVQGMAHRLARSGARAVLIKPGFVDTPMTAALPKGPLWAKPEKLGEIIVAAAEKGGPVIYAPAFWRLIMLIIRVVPAGIFHKTSL
jgi:NAD(P)-dependent dehydrogenase (short-subunit alcohol dehydrogenase family)